MKFNTNHLGYKLFSGSLKERRVHSEQLNKFVAGFFDSDGSVTARYDKSRHRMRLSSEITQSMNVDKDGRLLKSLCDYYGIGNIRYRQDVNATVWYMDAKDTKMFYGLIGKHLIVKRKHFENMISFYDNFQVEDLGILRKESRRTSSEFTHKKHISPAYLAGFICGDGYICAQLNKKRFNNKTKKHYYSNILKISVTLHEMDKSVLKDIQTDYGGRLNTRKDGLITWDISLGKSSVKSYNKISKIHQFLLLDYKYNSFQTIVNFHKQLAETKRKEPDKGI